MNLNELAKEMNVSEKDVLSLVSMVANSLDQDDMKETFISMSEAERSSTVAAYVVAEVKKFSEFCMSLLTNEDKKNAFSLYILENVSALEQG